MNNACNRLISLVLPVILCVSSTSLESPGATLPVEYVIWLARNESDKPFGRTVEQRFPIWGVVGRSERSSEMYTNNGELTYTGIESFKLNNCLFTKYQYF